jgi:hypothetical protein
VRGTTTAIVKETRGQVDLLGSRGSSLSGTTIDHWRPSRCLYRVGIGSGSTCSYNATRRNEGRYVSKCLSCMLPIMYIGTSSSPKEISSILYNPNLNNETAPGELALVLIITTSAEKSH